VSPRPRVPPPPLDVEAILGTLDRHGVEYVLIGGLAARLHGSPLLTEDLDITPAPDRENLGRLAEALRELEARLRGAEDVEFPLDDRSLASTEILTMTSRAGWLDVCRRPAGEQSYETLAPNAETYELFGLRVRVASVDDLIRSKTAAGRDKDLQGLPALRELKRRRG
jgi:hypothetical protein